MTDSMILQTVLFLVGNVAMAVGIYTGIRADMREYKIRIDMLEKHNEKHFCK